MEGKETKKKAAILRESFKLFLAQGYDAVSFTDIERAAQVTRGAIFHHFSGKEDLFKHVADQFIDAFLDTFLEEVDYGAEYLTSPTPLKDFMDTRLALIERRMTYFLKDVDVRVTSASFMSFILYLKDHHETWSEQMQEYEAKKIEAWSEAINLAKERGEIRPDTDTTMLAETFHHLYLGLSFEGAMIDTLSIPALRKQWEYLYTLHHIN
ncbi:TetR/AcrR family transcriptional regulator [uncultured Porphyromonas sp.]|uniref:TetR/AcrR family transcriptional regulator n=1 Tax=uncultured Porphyromonas sp. TaxID=159274 RepID=UPI002604080C|nr:TetR/AcrR family transcriptional regulator [uncultured Porphyromonas sp.]